MSKGRKHLGSILVESGVVTQQDIETALAHQRVHGGYLGEALLSLGLVQRPQVDWALASQFDLPYIVPEADSIEPAVAGLVSESWALSQLAVPIVLAGDVLTVVVADPLNRDGIIEELSARTGYHVELALAAPENIRELIRVLYGRPLVAAPTGRGQLSLAQLIADAFESGSTRIHLSSRGSYCCGWHATSAESSPLDPGWRDALEDLVRPSATDMIERTGDGTVEWDAILRWAGGLLHIQVHALVGAGGVEYLLDVGDVTRGAAGRRLILPVAISSALADAAGRVAVGGPDARFAAAALPHLPWLVAGDRMRSLHVCALGAYAAGVFSVAWDPAADALAGLDAFGFQAVTVDLPGVPEARLVHALEAAPLGFVRLDGNGDTRRDVALGLTHRLSVRPLDDGSIEWSLTTLDENV